MWFMNGRRRSVRTVSNWEKTMKEWDDSIPDGIKYLSAENRVLTRKVRELESENDALQARAEKAEAIVERLIEVFEKGKDIRLIPDPEINKIQEWAYKLKILVTEWKEREE